MAVNEETKQAEILVVDDERTVCQSIDKILGRRGHRVEQALSVPSALEVLEGMNGKRYDLVIADLMMPQVGGMELLKAIKDRWPDISVLIITGYASIASAVEATRLGAVGYLPKPFTPEELEEAVLAAISRPPSSQDKPSEPDELPPTGQIDVDLPFDARGVAEATSPRYVEHLTRSDMQVGVAPDYCLLGKRTCKRFVTKGMCKQEECPILGAERRKASRNAEVTLNVADLIDVDMPFSASEVAALTSDAYVASLGRSDLPIVGHWPAEDLGKAGQKVLVVDDEAVVVNSIRKILSRRGLGVDRAFSGAEGLARVLSGDYDLVLLDMKLPDMNGLDLVSKIKMRQPDLPVVMVTGFASIDTAVEAIRRGASDYVAKPFTPDELYALTGRFLSLAA